MRRGGSSDVVAAMASSVGYYLYVQLKAKYGGSYVFTMIASSDHATDAENLAKGLSPNVNKTYQISGTQKFELPKAAIKIAGFSGNWVHAKSRFTIQAWGLADTTLEDVFIKVAREAQPFEILS
uniref:ABC transporter A family member 7-like n=1 Tax=Erigeron canadensis TaxID=72917 RepID=UPI001CB8FB77|nr:ABC transporter A family member 7-like [Erigeron canadensis]